MIGIWKLLLLLITLPGRRGRTGGGATECAMDADDPRHPQHPKWCTRACCVVQKQPDSDEEDEPPPAKQQRTTTPAPAALSSAALATAPTPTGDTSRSEVLLGDRIMVGQIVKLNFQADHAGFSLNGTSGCTVAYEAASVERPHGRFQVDLKRDANGAVLKAVVSRMLKPENLQPVAPRPIPQRPDKLSAPAIDFSASNNRSSSSRDTETTFALAIEWLPEKDDLRGYVAMEKYDGVRAMWEGGRGGFRTRGGKPDKPLQHFPPSIEKLLPTDMRLDGEIWSRRGDFEGANCFRPAFHTHFKGSPAQIEERWANLSFKVYYS